MEHSGISGTAFEEKDRDSEKLKFHKCSKIFLFLTDKAVKNAKDFKLFCGKHPKIFVFLWNTQNVIQFSIILWDKLKMRCESWKS